MFTNRISTSFDPQTGPEPEIWVGSRALPRRRWQLFQSNSLGYCSDSAYFCSTDIEKYFDNIDHSLLIKVLLDLYTPLFGNHSSIFGFIISRICELLEHWSPDIGCGLPQNGDASFFFSELILLPLDEYLLLSSCQAQRYNDEFRLWANDEYVLYREFEQLEAMLHAMKLHFNPFKVEFGESRILAERLIRMEKKKKQFKRDTNNCWLASEFIHIVLEALMEELAEGDIDRPWINYLISALHRKLQDIGRMKDSQIADLAKSFNLHRCLAGDVILIWQSLLAGMINHPAIQELVLEIIITDDRAMDTEKALLYGCFSAAEHIHNADIRRKSLSLWEREAMGLDSVTTGSEASRVGKALLALSQHGNGADILFAKQKQGIWFSESRLYAVACASRLPEKQRNELLSKMSAECRSLDERLEIAYFEAGGEWVAPERTMQPVLTY